jgi:hypothetical protein
VTIILSIITGAPNVACPECIIANSGSDPAGAIEDVRA